MRKKIIWGIMGGLVLVRGWFFFSSLVDYPVDRQVVIKGRISNVPTRHGYYQIFRLGRVGVKIDRFKEVKKGDEVVLVGKLEERVITPFWSQYYLNYPTIRNIRPTSVGVISNWFLQLRERLIRVFRRCFPQSLASLVAGMSFGLESDLPPRLEESFKKTGLFHVVVASGANVVVLANLFCKKMQQWWGRRAAVIVGIGWIWFYVGVAGAEPAVVRAALMASVAYWAQWLGRRYSAQQALGMTALVMLFFRPPLIFNLGFQLSLAATAGIIFWSSWLKKKLKWSVLATTLGAQMLTWPVLAIYFGQIYPLTLLSNLLLLWLVDFIMIGGMLLGGLGVVFLPAAKLVSHLLWLPLEIFSGGAVWLAEWSYSWQPGRYSALGYGVFLLFLIWFKRREEADFV